MEKYNRSAVVPSELRVKNLKTIFGIVFKHQPISRTEISNHSGISKPTVSKIIRSLLDDEFLIEAGKTSEGIGKNRTLLSLNPKKIYTITADIGLDNTIVSIVDLSMKLSNKRVITTNKKLNKFVGEFASCIVEYLEKKEENPAHLVISVPGLVKSNLREAINIPLLHWENIDLAKLIEEELAKKGISIEVFINNDAKLATLAEVSLNPELPGNQQNIVCVLVKEGIGTGLFLDGRLYTGSNHTAGEFGHMVIDRSGPICSCGRKGCWLTMAGSRELEKYVKDSRLDEYIEIFSIGLMNIINALDPNIVVINGAVEKYWNDIYPALDKKLKQHNLNNNPANIKILSSIFDDRVGPLLGGALMSFRKYIQKETG
ncbi:MAG: ROK family transcriptional regulator [Thermotogota bacterium]|nr:ROK family transcriptional regulator [Thermotogota bacterium]